MERFTIFSKGDIEKIRPELEKLGVPIPSSGSPVKWAGVMIYVTDLINETYTVAYELPSGFHGAVMQT